MIDGFATLERAAWLVGAALIAALVIGSWWATNPPAPAKAAPSTLQAAWQGRTFLLRPDGCVEIGCQKTRLRFDGKAWRECR